MPTTYGQVAGIKHYATQPEYDPEHPKHSIYAPKVRRPAAAKPRKEPTFERRIWGHGARAWKEKLCTCDVCRAAYDRMREKDKESKRRRSEALHMSEDRTQARCSRCGRFKPTSEFPYIATSRNDKWVCRECKDRLEAPGTWRR